MYLAAGYMSGSFVFAEDNLWYSLAKKAGPAT
jgi:hypothetical protein